MIRKQYYFKNNTKNYKNLWQDTQLINIKYSPPLTCEGNSTRCSGKYIKTRDYQDICLHCIIERDKHMDKIKYQIISPNTLFPLWNEYEKYFKIDNNTIFTFENKIYTSNELPNHLIEHEKMHIKQQNSIGCDNWVSLYLRDSDFRLKQEIEAYKYQLSVIKDKNEKTRLRKEIIKHLSSDMYGNIATEDEVDKLLKQ